MTESDGSPAIAGGDLVAGAVLLELVSDWDTWVYRRVDSFSFPGDDETLLERKHSVDFELPKLAAQTASDLGRACWIPLSFMRKWRLPHLSIRDEWGRALPLVSREQYAPVLAGMLVACAYRSRRLGFPDRADDLIPTDVERDLRTIVTLDASPALNLWSRLGEVPCEITEPEATASRRWRDDLSRDQVFMSLAAQLATSFLLIVELERDDRGRRIVKVSYDWSAHRPSRLRRRDRLRALRRGHHLRSVPFRWPRRLWPRRRQHGQLVLSNVSETLVIGSRDTEPTEACVTARVKRRWRPGISIALRPNTAVSLVDLPAGEWQMHLTPSRGFELLGEARSDIRIGPDEEARYFFRSRQTDITPRPRPAPNGLSSLPPRRTRFVRGLAWRSKPVVVRLSVGDGGSRHCEFEAPAGMHVTRARLVADRPGRFGRDRELDIVLESVHRAHVYVPAASATPAAAYALLNLRPRVETIVRPALLTSVIVSVITILVAIKWHKKTGLGQSNTTAVALLFTAPGALAAYFAQAVPSRVTNAMLFGLRVAALIPGLVGIGVAGIVIVGENSHWAKTALIIGAICSGLALLNLRVTFRWSRWPLEQRRTNRSQDGRFLTRYAPGRPVVASTSQGAASGSATPTTPDEIRDSILERVVGFTRETLSALLAQQLVRRSLVPPALYFDAAESPPAFRPPETGGEWLRRLRADLRDADRPPREAARQYDRLVANRRGT